uniref:LIM domain 7a n=1 Tax=Cyprinus carpio TaxID=7962 RepID=A0A8C1THL4_CYPCA
PTILQKRLCCCTGGLVSWTCSLEEQLSSPFPGHNLPTYWFLVLPVFVLVSQAVTKKKFVSSNFRSSLENGLLLCDLINKIRPGVVKKLNRLSTPIAGLDNISLFLKACAKLGLKEAQLFHPGDLQDLSTRVTVKHQESSRRLKNVLITIYWLGRKTHADPFYNGPYLKLKAFEGLLGKALNKVRYVLTLCSI